MEENTLVEIAWLLEDFGAILIGGLFLTGDFVLDPNGVGSIILALVGVAGIISLAHKSGFLGGDD